MPLFRNPHLLLALTTFIWSGNAIAGKFAIGHVSPMMLTMSRWAVALVIIALIARKHIADDWQVIRKNWLYLLLMGGIGYTGFNYCLYSGLQHISAINVTLEQSAMPLIIFILNYAIYRTGITWLQIVGFVLTFLGVIVIVSSGQPIALFSGEGPGINIGDIYMLGAAICYGGYSTALRSKPTMHWQSFLACLVAGALIFGIVGAMVEYQAGHLQAPVTLQGLSVVLYAGIFASLVAQGLFIKGVEAFGSNIAGIYINLVPVFGALLAVLLLGEQLYLFHAVAFVLVVGGILIAQRKTESAAAAAAPPAAPDKS
ncbi:MAG: DMT family transporter [Rhizobiaceae bacterium]